MGWDSRECDFPMCREIIIPSRFLPRFNSRSNWDDDIASGLAKKCRDGQVELGQMVPADYGEDGFFKGQQRIIRVFAFKKDNPPEGQLIAEVGQSPQGIHVRLQELGPRDVYEVVDKVTARKLHSIV